MSDAIGLGEMLDVVGYNYQESRYTTDHQRYANRSILGYWPLIDQRLDCRTAC
jgi:beta-galactosidase